MRAMIKIVDGASASKLAAPVDGGACTLLGDLTSACSATDQQCLESCSEAVSRDPGGVLLHVGCGAASRSAIPRRWRGESWRHVRLDIDPAVQPDVIGDIRDMPAVANASVDVVFSSHNLEHVYAHEVPSVLGEFRRVMKPGGTVCVTLPDLQEVARHVVEGRLEQPLYTSPSGPISALDVLYGFNKALTRGHLFMAHKTGFTADSLEAALVRAGFVNVHCVRRPADFALWATANKPT